MSQDISVLVNDKPVRQIAHEGKLYIVAKPGTPYEVRIKNNSTGRIMAVASIDGLSVLDGKPANPDGPGYVIQGYSSYTIKGWRTSNDSVSPFEFSKKIKSYAAKSEDGDIRNAGAIGVIIHAEKLPDPPKTVYIDRYIERQPYIYPYRVAPYWYSVNDWTYTSSAASSQNMGMVRSANMGCFSNCNTVSTMARNSSPTFDLGTKFSERSVTDRVDSTEFKSSHILTKVEIYYASESQLRAMGVPVDKSTGVAFPQAFSGGFCSPPRK